MSSLWISCRRSGVSFCHTRRHGETGPPFRLPVGEDLGNAHYIHAGEGGRQLVRTGQFPQVIGQKPDLTRGQETGQDRETAVVVADCLLETNRFEGLAGLFVQRALVLIPPASGQLQADGHRLHLVLWESHALRLQQHGEDRPKVRGRRELGRRAAHP